MMESSRYVRRLMGLLFIAYILFIFVFLRDAEGRGTQPLIHLEKGETYCVRLSRVNAEKYQKLDIAVRYGYGWTAEYQVEYDAKRRSAGFNWKYYHRWCEYWDEVDCRWEVDDYGRSGFTAEELGYVVEHHEYIPR